MRNTRNPLLWILLLLGMGLACVGSLLVWQNGGAAPLEQWREMTWWSLPWGDQVTCGLDDGVYFEQFHTYEWRGERPDWIYIYVTGPNTYDFSSGVFIPHYSVIDVFPSVWEWETDFEDYRERWIRGRLKDNMWVEGEHHTVPIGYKIRLYPIQGDVFTADHFMAGLYGTVSRTVNAGRSTYDATDCYFAPVYLPIILK